MPREIGSWRSMGYKLRALSNHIKQNSGKNPCFTSLYRIFVVKDFVSEIDKIFFDFDGEFEDFVKFYKVVKSSNFPIIPVITGKKGYHAYIILKTKHYAFPESKLLLTNAAHYLLNLVFKKVPKSVDRHIIGIRHRISLIIE